MKHFLVEPLLAVAWVLFRAGPPRDSEQNLAAIRWTVGICHAIAALGFIFHIVAGGSPWKGGAGILCVGNSLFFLLRRYRRLSFALREEAVKEVLES